MLKSLCYFIFLFIVSGCKGTFLSVTGSAFKGEETISNINLLPEPNLVFDGEQSKLVISLTKPASTNFPFTWVIKDLDGNNATTSKFLQISGSGLFLKGETTKNIYITSLSNSVTAGVDDYRIHFTSGGATSAAKLSIRSAADSGFGVNTVSIVNLENDSFVNSTNRSTYTISGICSTDGGAINITATRGPDSVNEVTVCNSSNTWTADLDFSSVAADGVFDVTVTHSATGLTGSAFRQIIKDVSVPSVAITSPAIGAPVGSTSAGAFVISGTCTENNTTITLNATSSGGAGSVETVAKCSSLAWSSILNLSSLPDGTITIAATIKDFAGNESTTSRNFNKDVIQPTLTIDAPAMAAVVNGLNFNSQTFSGQCSENGSSIALSGDVSGTLVTTCNSLTWTLNAITISGSDGLKNIVATVTDAGGNTSYKSVMLIKDTTSPIASLSGTPENNHNSLNVLVGGLDVTIYRYKLGDNTLDCTVASGYSPNISNSVLITDAIGSDGAKKLCVLGIDSAGNIQDLATATTFSWTKNTVAPYVTIASPAANSYVNSLNATSFAVSGTCELNGENVILHGSLTRVTTTCSSNTWSYNVNFSAADDGPVVLLVTQEDPITGNAGEATRIFVKSTSLPSIAITNPAVNSYINNSNKAAFTVTGTCDSYSATPNIAVSGGVATVNVACSGSTWTADLVFGDNINATPVVTATITNDAGNPRSTTRSFVQDTVNPVLAITSPAANGYISLSNMASFPVNGTCSDNRTSSVIVTDALDNVLSTLNCASNVWSTNLNLSSFAEGPHTLTFIHSDPAGNTHEVDRVFIKDSVAPAVEWGDLVSGVCISSGTASSFSVDGTCSNGSGDSDVTITSPQLAAPVTLTCSGGAFNTTLNFNTAGLADRQNFNVTVSQTDSAANQVSSVRSLRFISSAPTINFEGWEDVYAVGKKTYHDGNPDEPGVVRFAWKSWPASNTCQPEFVKVFRAPFGGGVLASGTEISPVGGIPTEVRSFTDTTLVDSDFGKAWYYALKVMIAGVEYDVSTPVPINEIRVIAPPENMALVHRWITNQEVCGLMNKTSDPLNHYRCLFAGQGKIVDVQDYHDMEHDLLVDRFEMGCNVSSTCGAGGSTRCVSQNFSNLENPATSTGVQAAVGSVYYANSGSVNGGLCSLKVGAGNTDWVAINSAPGANLLAMTSYEAHLPPLVYVNRTRANQVCSAHEISLDQVEEYNDSVATNIFPIEKRLLRMKEWKAAAAWKLDVDFPDVYTDVHDWIDRLEKASFMAGDPDGPVGKCNSSSRHSNLSAGARDFLGGYNIHILAFETGSKLATSNCKSRYGIQDMVGNVGEWGSDEFFCSGSNCTGITSSLDSENTFFNGFAFNGVQGQNQVGSIGYQDRPFGLNYFNVVLGLPIISSDGSSLSITGLGTPFFHNDVMNLPSLSGTRAASFGGRWGDGEGNGRWMTSFENAPSALNSSLGVRCSVPVK